MLYLKPEFFFTYMKSQHSLDEIKSGELRLSNPGFRYSSSRLLYWFSGLNRKRFLSVLAHFD
jgi:hypothetical protein